MNPSARVGRHGGEGGEGERKQAKALGAPKKEHPMQEMELTLLLTLTRPFQSELWLTLMMTAFLWTLRELHEAKQKVRERKRRLQQLLLRRSGAPATPIVLVAVAPFFSQASVTSTQRTFPRGPLFSSRSGCPEQPRRRRLVRSFRRTIW